MGPATSARFSFPHNNSTRVSANGNAVPIDSYMDSCQCKTLASADDRNSGRIGDAIHTWAAAAACQNDMLEHFTIQKPYENLGSGRY